MGDEALNLQQQAELRFLRNEVNKYEREVNRAIEHPNVQRDLHRARGELKEFTANLRKQGVNI
tara:strand:+ start:421 stop:609 length:189 start_codon:yes stop_codon:yes gene_type:complete